MTATDHISLFVTSGNGPAECQQAVAKVLDAMRQAAEISALDFDSSGSATRHGFKSAVIVISGTNAQAFANTWRGTIQWRAKSSLRAHHKRANWFIGIFDLPQPVQMPAPIRETDVAYESFRAGGPGGQHQNTTDSAVRATHRPTGLSATAREERSQHRNKSLALKRLHQLITAEVAANEEALKAQRNHLHHALERGNPVRCFKGPNFLEERRG